MSPIPSTKSAFDTEHLKDDLKGRSVRGGTVTMLGQGIHFVIQSISTVVLARLLVPADFGLIAMVTAVIGFATLFKDLGLSMATIQKDEITHDQVSVLFWVNVGVSAVLALITAGVAPAIAWFYGEPRLTPITIALSLVFLLGGLTVQHSALLKRQMQFTALVAINVSSMLAGAVFAIIAASLGMQYWSLVIMQATVELVNMLGVWLLCDWRPGRPKRNADVKSMLIIGGNITGFDVVNYFARNADSILIGRVCGSGALGFYNRAYSLFMLPINQLNIPLATVAVPALSRLHGDPPKYKAYYLKVISLITLISTPVAGICIVCADNLILLILGSQWAAAGNIFAVLGFSALIQPLYNTQGWLHITAGRSDRYLRWGLVGSIIIVLAFIVGLPYGPIGVAVAYTIATWVIIGPCMWYAGHSSGIGLRDIYAAVSKNLLSGLCSIAISLFLTKHVLLVEAMWLNLLIGLCSICVTYGLFLLIFYRDLSPWYQLTDVAATLRRPLACKPTL